MARNGSGTYTVPNSFTAGAVITASDHNENWSDVSSEITNSVAADGQTSMTGPLKASSGTAAAPSHTFGADTDTGGYRSGANEYSVAAGGVQIAAVNSSGFNIKTGTLYLAGVAAFPVAAANIDSNAVTTAKIADNNVTAAKLAAAATNKLFGRYSSGAGGGEEIGISSAFTMSGGTLAMASGGLTWAAFPDGTIIDRAYDEDTTVSTVITPYIPYDNTIPQSSEGTELLSASITPKSTTNRVRVRASVPAASASDLTFTIALFNGGTSAIAAVSHVIENQDAQVCVLEFEHVPGSTSTQTYTLRVAGNGNQTDINGNGAGTRILGGVSRATLVIEEIKAS